MNLERCANQVMQEFGGAMPEHLLGMEDAAREFMAVRALELQKLGISGTDKTVINAALGPTRREDLVPGQFGHCTPAFAQLAPTDGSARVKVEIVPIESVPHYDGSRAIGFYGNPLNYMLSWDAWEEGEVYLWGDAAEDLTTLSMGSDIVFPEAFWVYLFKKTALNLVRIANLKISFQLSDDASLAPIIPALAALREDLTVQCSEWQKEFKKYTNLDLNTQPHLRRSVDELWARGSHEVTIG
jgi:hypothetical protein